MRETDTDEITAKTAAVATNMSIVPCGAMRTKARQRDAVGTAFLALGGNIGAVEDAFRYALARLNAQAGRVLAVSPLYQTVAWGGVEQPNFLNACVKLATCLSPQLLLELCLQTEQAKGRRRALKWGPRSLDIDILLYYDADGQMLNLHSDSLTLPHPLIEQRRFVLTPLSVLAPQLHLHGRSLRDLARELSQKQNDNDAVRQVKSAAWAQAALNAP